MKKGHSHLELPLYIAIVFILAALIIGWIRHDKEKDGQSGSSGRIPVGESAP